MLNQLLSLFNNENLERFQTMLEKEFKMLESKYDDKSLFVDETSFKEVNGNYVMTLNVKENSNNDNIKIDFKNKVVTVTYTEKSLKTERTVKVLETIPNDADENTLDAYVENGKLIITVSKKPTFTVRTF